MWSHSLHQRSRMDAKSLRLDAGELHDLRPFLGFLSDELGKVGGRAPKRHAAQLGKSCLQLRIGEAGVDFLVELVDDLGRRVSRSAEAAPEACFEAWEKIADGGDIWQKVRARCARHRKRT